MIAISTRGVVKSLERRFRADRGFSHSRIFYSLTDVFSRLAETSQLNRRCIALAGPAIRVSRRAQIALMTRRITRNASNRAVIAHLQQPEGRPNSSTIFHFYFPGAFDGRTSHHKAAGAAIDAVIAVQRVRCALRGHPSSRTAAAVLQRRLQTVAARGAESRVAGAQPRGGRSKSLRPFARGPVAYQHKLFRGFPERFFLEGTQ